MDINKMLADLRAEREQIEEAIMTLERLARGRGRRRGRPPAWMSTIKREGDLSDPSICLGTEWLVQREVISGDRKIEVGLPPLARRIGNEGPGLPARVGIAVNGVIGTVLWRIGDGVSI